MIPSELFMFKNVFIIIVSDFVEVIHVQLSHKGRKISMPEMNRQNFLLELLNINDNEIGSFLVPRYDILIDIILNRNKYYL